eukprot:SAG25_NODE_8752_length_406_cov_0.485342_1_plen_87_part_01
MAYKVLNVVDVHNQGRQDLVKLERTWHTRNCWFRQLCFGIGLVTQNTWKHRQNHLQSRDTHSEFILKLAYQLATVQTLKVDANTTLT